MFLLFYIFIISVANLVFRRGAGIIHLPEWCGICGPSAGYLHRKRFCCSARVQARHISGHLQRCQKVGPLWSPNTSHAVRNKRQLFWICIASQVRNHFYWPSETSHRNGGFAFLVPEKKKKKSVIKNILVTQELPKSLWKRSLWKRLWKTRFV